MPPSVLIIAGLDPSGGAGLSADIETLHALGCHPLPLISALTVQDSHKVHAFVPTDPDLLRRQLATLLADLPVQAIKLGMLGNAAIAAVVFELLQQKPQVPVICDPVLAGNLAGSLAQSDLLPALQRLWPRVHLLTPNAIELTALTTQGDVGELLAAGIEHVLLTGGHTPGAQLTNTLYSRGQAPQNWHIDRLIGEFHGSGCTLAAACAAGLAHGLPITAAVAQAQDFTTRALRHAFTPGHGQSLPWR